MNQEGKTRSRQLFVGEEFNPDLVYNFHLSKLRRHEMWNLFTDLPKERRNKYELKWPYVKTHELLPPLLDNFLYLNKVRLFQQLPRIIEVEVDHDLRFGNVYYMSDEGEDEDVSDEEENRKDDELVSYFGSALYV